MHLQTRAQKRPAKAREDQRRPEKGRSKGGVQMQSMGPLLRRTRYIVTWVGELRLVRGDLRGEAGPR